MTSVVMARHDWVIWMGSDFGAEDDSVLTSTWNLKPTLVEVSFVCVIPV